MSLATRWTFMISKAKVHVFSQEPKGKTIIGCGVFPIFYGENSLLIPKHS